MIQRAFTLFAKNTMHRAVSCIANNNNFKVVPYSFSESIPIGLLPIYKIFKKKILCVLFKLSKEVLVGLNTQHVRQSQNRNGKFKYLQKVGHFCSYSIN